MRHFDLESSISKWKTSLNVDQLEDGIKQELENHLRDGIEELLEEGLEEADAFEEMVRRIGQTARIGKESVKSRVKSNWMMHAMFLQTVLIQWRLIKRRSIYALINVLGLALGFACCLLIALYVNHELSYDNFHGKADRIFRIAANSTIGGSDRSWALVPSSLAPALYAEVPEVINFTHVLPANQSQKTVRIGDKLFDENKEGNGVIYMTDTAFFKVFDFEFISGRPETAMIPNSVVITESRALKLFDRIDVQGEIIEILNIGELAISAVIKDPPDNAHFQFGYLVHSDFQNNPFNTFFWVRSYLLTNTEYDQEVIESKIQPITERVTAETLLSNNIRIFPFLQNLRDIHLTSDLEYELGVNGNQRTVWSFGLIALVIVLIAGINFTNLSTAKSALRAREIGVRKVLGARKRQLINQFLAESVSMSFLALSLGFLLVMLFLPYFNSLSGKSFDLSDVFTLSVVAISIAFSVLIGLVAGMYPAFFMSNFRPLSVLKGIFSAGKGQGFFRKGLVVVQFSISVILIFSTIVVLRQTRFMKDQDLGFTRDQVVVLPMDRGWSSREFALIKNEMNGISEVVSASLSSHIPGMRGGVMAMLPEGFAEKETQVLDGVYADFDFLKTYELKLSLGRGFNELLSTDSVNFIVNQAALKKFGWPENEEVIGKEISSQNNGSTGLEGKIIGVTQDAHFRSLHHTISPMLFGITNSKFPFLGVNYLSLRVSDDNISAVLNQVEKRWNKLELDKPFSYSLLNQELQELYEAEEKASEMLISFSFLAILIACLGLLALAAFTTERKTKEIGIRKTLGATITQLSGRITWGFAQWVLMANLIAWPVAGLLMNQWLQGFAYRTDLSVWAYVSAALISLLIALLTVGYMSVRAARANPVKALRYE